MRIWIQNALSTINTRASYLTLLLDNLSTTNLYEGVSYLELTWMAYMRKAITIEQYTEINYREMRKLKWCLEFENN